jgi:protein-tyrosine-phosphatase
MNKNPIIIFVCEHGAAKSIIAAAYFNQVAKQKGLDLKAVARGTNPDHELSPSAVHGLANDGLVPTESTPKQLSLADMQSAQRIVSFCELPIQYRKGGSSREHPRRRRSAPTIEQWEDVPPVSENYEKARNAIIEHLNILLDNLRSVS